MNLHKFQIILLFVLIVSCKKQPPSHVLFLSVPDGGINYVHSEILNGNVKQLITKGGSPKKDNYYQTISFDKSGNPIYSEKQYLDIIETEKSTDSTIISEKIKYTTLNDANGNKMAITGIVLGGEPYKINWDFDKTGYLVNSKFGKYKYNTAGDLIEVKLGFPVLIEPDLYKYLYDENHHLIESSLNEPNVSSFDPKQDGKDRLLAKTRYEYKTFDSHNNWLVRIAHSQTYSPLQVHFSTDTSTRKITYYN